VFFEEENIRDLVVTGYLTVYKILSDEDKTVVLGFYK